MGTPTHNPPDPTKPPRGGVAAELAMFIPYYFLFQYLMMFNYYSSSLISYGRVTMMKSSVSCVTRKELDYKRWKPKGNLEDFVFDMVSLSTTLEIRENEEAKEVMKKERT